MSAAVAGPSGGSGGRGGGRTPGRSHEKDKDVGSPYARKVRVVKPRKGKAPAQESSDEEEAPPTPGKTEPPFVSKTVLRNSLAIRAPTSLEQTIMETAVRSDAPLQFRNDQGNCHLIETPGSSYRPAMLAHIRARATTTGPNRPTDCSHCLRSHGPFQHCRTMVHKDGTALFQGACTNCAFGNHWGRCEYFSKQRSYSRLKSTNQHL